MASQSKTTHPYPSQPTAQWSSTYIFKGVLGVIAGLFIHLFLGALYSWGTVSIYITSYYKTLDSSVTLENNVIAFPLMMFCVGLTMRLGIYFAQVTHPIIALSTSCLMIATTVFISSYMTHIWGFLFFYGIFFGLIMGTLFMVPIVQCNKYFPGKKMYVNGVIMSGGGFGSMTFGMFAFSYLNPEKLKPFEGYYLGTPELEDIAAKVPTLLRLIALLELIIGIVAVLLIAPVCLENRRVENEQKEKQKQKVKQLENHKKQHAQTQSQLTPPNQSLQIFGEATTLQQAFCSKICWIEVSFVMLVGCALYLMNGNYKTYVKKTINDDEFLTLIGVAGAIANGCSRFVWNIIFLKTGYKFVMLSLLGVEITVLATIRLTVHTPGAYLIQILLINFCLGGLLTTTTTVLQVIFGQKTGSNIAGFYWCCIATTNFIQYFYVSNLSKTIGFDNIIYIVLGMACAAVPILVLTKFQGPWMNDTSAVGYFISWQKGEIKPLKQEIMEENRTQGVMNLKKEESMMDISQVLRNEPENQHENEKNHHEQEEDDNKKEGKRRNLGAVKLPAFEHKGHLLEDRIDLTPKSPEKMDERQMRDKEYLQDSKLKLSSNEKSFIEGN